MVGKSAIKIRGTRKILKQELIPFTQQSSSMLAAGMTILATIQTLSEQCENPEFRKVLDHLGRMIEGGSPMSEGLADFPQFFDDMYVNMVVAGEQSGEFASILKRLGMILSSISRLRGKVKSAMTYPIVIICIALLLAGGLIQFVVPVFARMFSDVGKDLPWLTQSMVDISDFVKAWWYVLIPSVLAAIWLFIGWKRTKRGRFIYDGWMLKMPIFGQLNQKVAIARFCRLLSQMVAAGVPILRSLKVVAGSLGNTVLEKSIIAARQEVEQGNQISPSLEGKPFIPILMVRMLAAGEKSGKVEEMLDSVANSYDESVENLLNTLTALMEPLLMVLLGVVIGTIVLAMFLPVFQLGLLAS